VDIGHSDRLLLRRIVEVLRVRVQDHTLKAEPLFGRFQLPDALNLEVTAEFIGYMVEAYLEWVNATFRYPISRQTPAFEAQEFPLVRLFQFEPPPINHDTARFTLSSHLVSILPTVV
jgi:hypothetical protein